MKLDPTIKAKVLALYAAQTVKNLSEIRRQTGVDRTTIRRLCKEQPVTKPQQSPISIEVPSHTHRCGIDCAWGCPLEDQPSPVIVKPAPDIVALLQERPRAITELVEVLDLAPSQVRALLVETDGMQPRSHAKRKSIGA